MPTHCGKLVLLFFVTNAVAFNLFSPECRVAFWHNKIFAAFMTMPKV